VYRVGARDKPEGQWRRLCDLCSDAGSAHAEVVQVLAGAEGVVENTLAVDAPVMCKWWCVFDTEEGNGFTCIPCLRLR